MKKNTDFFQFLVMKGKGLWFVSKSRFLYCSLQHFHNYYKVQSSGIKEKEMDFKRSEKPQWKAVETRRQNNFESLEMLQSEVFQIFCIIYSCILFTAHSNLPDVMLTTNTFA